MTSSVSLPTPRRRPDNARQRPVEQVTGLCWPGAPDSDLDALAVRSLFARRQRCVEVLSGGPTLHPALRTFVGQIPALGAIDALRLFDSAAAALTFGWTPAQVVDDPPFEPGWGDYARWLVSSWAESPDAEGFTVSPPSPEALGTLWLETRSATVRVGHGPVAVFNEQHRTRFVPADGPAVTLPRDMTSAPVPSVASVPPHPGGVVWRLGSAAGHPVLNGVPTIERFAPGRGARAEELQAGARAMADAVQLLEAVWPAAAAFTYRWLRGVVVLHYPGYAQSHTSVHAPQVLFCTAESALKGAEAICHELAHARLLVFLEHGAIWHNDASVRHPSPWRKDPRPLLGHVAGVHAFLNVCELYRRLAELDRAYAAEADSVLGIQREKITNAWRYVTDHAAWTEEGTRFASDLDGAVGALCHQ